MNRTLLPDYILHVDPVLAGRDTIDRSLLPNFLGIVETTLKAALLVTLIRRDASNMYMTQCWLLVSSIWNDLSILIPLPLHRSLQKPPYRLTPGSHQKNHDDTYWTYIKIGIRGIYWECSQVQWFDGFSQEWPYSGKIWPFQRLKSPYSFYSHSFPEFFSIMPWIWIIKNCILHVFHPDEKPG